MNIPAWLRRLCGQPPVDVVAWRNAEFQILLAEFHYPRIRGDMPPTTQSKNRTG
jgi:hypothetical protein